MSKAAELAALIGSQTALSNRNLIINGAMQVAQRGTSETGVTSGGYKQAPDRWNIAMSSAGTWTVSQSTTVPSGEGFSHSYKFDCTTADASLSAGDHLVLAHYIEAQNVAHLGYGTASAKKLTLSFWVRSAKTGTYVLELVRNDDNRHIAQTYTISSANTWERKTLTFDGDTGGSAIPHDNGRGFEVNFWLAAGSTFSGGTLATSWAANTAANRAAGVLNLADSTSNDWYMTGVQLEVGEQATPFEHRSFGEERLACYRYFFQFGTDGSTGVSGTNNNSHISYAYAKSATAAEAWVSPPLPMRVQPTVTVSATGDVSCHLPGFIRNAATALSTQDNLSGFNAVCLNVTYASDSNFTNGKVCSFEFTGSGGKFLRMDAEL